MNSDTAYSRPTFRVIGNHENIKTHKNENKKIYSVCGLSRAACSDLQQTYRKKPRHKLFQFFIYIFSYIAPQC